MAARHRLRVLPPQAWQAHLVASRRELFELYKALRRAMRRAEMAGERIIAEQLRRMADDVMTRLRQDIQHLD
jgi:hypothetical protein